MKRILHIILTAVTLCSLNGCKDQERSIVAVVNDTKITAQDFRNEIRLYHIDKISSESLKNSERFFEIKKDILNQAIREAILLEEAKKMGINVGDKEIADKIEAVTRDFPGDSFSQFLLKNGISYGFWKKKIKNGLIIEKFTRAVTFEIPKIADSEISDYYIKNEQEFTLPEQVRAYQIVVKNEEEAYRIYNELRRNKKFEDLAEEFSITPEAARGGDMGYFSRGSMPQEFDDVLFSLDKGRISKVVKSDFGYHIFKVTDKKPGRSRTSDEVKDEIIGLLASIKRDEYFSEWLKEKIAASKIERNNGLLAGIK